MEKDKIIDLLENAPVIAAIKNPAGLEECLLCDAQVVFVLYGTLVDIPGIVAQIKNTGKAVFVHIDLIDGLAARDVAVDYIAGSTMADGIITTKTSLVARARANNLLVVRRFFLLDSMALQNMQRQLSPDVGDLIEVLPGVMPKMLRQIAGESPVPLIAGGLIRDKDDVVNALSAGAMAVSSTNPTVWYS